MHKYHKKNIKTKKFKPEICDNKMTFQECELAILRQAVDETEKIQGEKIAKNDEIKKILLIVENFIRKKKLVCYGGTAINNILPKQAQFYDRDVEIPDYDFFSPNALEDAKELADIYYKEGYIDVEAKSGVHMGTFKVFVNYIPIADITLLDKVIYKSISKESIIVSGIRYAPPNYLRMAMYLELSRPQGDVSRWEKVMKRLTLLNDHYPMKPNGDCNNIDFQRKMDSDSDDSERLYITIRDAFINESVIFFGGYATSLYSKYMTEKQQHIVRKIPDFDVISEDPEKCAIIIKEHLMREGFKQIKFVRNKPIGEIIPENIELRVGNETMAFIYKPIACHSYNTIVLNNMKINIATIDTILAFYLSFIYADKPYYQKDRLLCMAQFLFEIEQKNRLEQKGLLKRFSIDCYGKQPTLEEMRAEKSEKFKELKNKRNTKEFEMWFLKYVPGDKKKSKEKSVAAPKDSSIMVEENPSIDAEEDGDGFLNLFIGNNRKTRKNKLSNMIL
jgi:hypothetical protein